MDRLGCGTQDDLRQQAVRPQPQRGGNTLQAEDRDLGAAGIRPAGCGRPADPGTQQTSRQPVHVPFAGHGRDVPPRLGGEAPRKSPEGRWAGTHSFPRPETPKCQAQDTKQNPL